MNEPIKDITLILVLLISVVTDMRWRRIPNVLTAPALAAALILNVISGGTDGVMFCLKGAGVGVLVMMLPYVMGGMGGGDVKLMGVVGAVKGAAFVFTAFIYTAVAGGLIAIACLLIKGRSREVMYLVGRKFASVGNGCIEGGCREGEREGKIPYACAISAGVMTAYYMKPLFF